MIILRYTLRNYFMSLLRQIGYVMSLVIIVDFIDVYALIGQKGANLAQTGLLVLLRIPDRMLTYLPLIVLLSSMFCLLRLARNSELVIYRAAGIPLSRIVCYVVLGTVIMSLFASVIFSPVLARSVQLAQSYQAQVSGKPDILRQQTKNGIWLRDVIDDETRVIYIEQINWGRQTLGKTEIILSRDGIAKGILLAQRARFTPNSIELQNVQSSTFDPDLEQAKQDRLSLPSSQDFSSLFSSITDERTINVFEYPAFLNELESDGYETSEAKTYFYAQYSMPIFLAAIAMIGAVFALAPMRGGGTVPRVLTALITGFTVYGMTQFTHAMGKAGDLPPLLAVLAIPTATILIAVGLLIHREDG